MKSSLTRLPAAVKPQTGAAPLPATESPTALPSLPLDLRQWQNQQERDVVEISLQQAKYNQRRAASLLGVTYHQLRAIMKKHGIQARDGQH